MTSDLELTERPLERGSYLDGAPFCCDNMLLDSTPETSLEPPAHLITRSIKRGHHREWDRLTSDDHVFVPLCLGRDEASSFMKSEGSFEDFIFCGRHGGNEWRTKYRIGLRDALLAHAQR